MIIQLQKIDMWPWPQKPVIKGQFFDIEIYISSWKLINNISIDVWFVGIGQYLAEIIWNNYLKIWNLRLQKNLNIEENCLYSYSN